MKTTKPFSGYREPKTGIVHFHSPVGDDRTFCGDAFDHMEDGEMMEFGFIADKITCPRCVQLLKATLKYFK